MTCAERKREVDLNLAVLCAVCRKHKIHREFGPTEIAEIAGTTRQVISMCEQRALEKLRQSRMAKSLKDDFMYLAGRGL